MPTESETTTEGVVIKSAKWDAIRAEFVVAQDGRCAICRMDIASKPCLDHCHVSGHIRGALCTGCNVMLGWYEKRRKAVEGYLARAAEYEAYRVMPRETPAQQAVARRPATRQAERWRAYWQQKHLK